MKLISTALIALGLSLSVSAMEVICVTEFPTTSVVGDVEGDEFVVNIIHHNGMKYMPIYTGMTTPNDLATLAEKANDFAKLGDHYIFRWPLANCKREDSDIMGCSGGASEFEVNGTKVKPWGMYTKRIHTESDIFSYEQVEVSFLLEIDGKNHSFSMQYAKGECAQTLESRKAVEKFLSKK
ncbi:MAG: hypothetical protein ACLGHN_08965 [Bacteriovoracia bacterium]